MLPHVTCDTVFEKTFPAVRTERGVYNLYINKVFMFVLHHCLLLKAMLIVKIDCWIVLFDMIALKYYENITCQHCTRR